MSTENKVKRVRAPNWETVEKKLLREVLADYVDIIEDKCTDTNTNKRKYHAWQKVYERFNELNVRQRALVELKQQWRMSKVDAKKIMSEHRMPKTKLVVAADHRVQMKTPLTW
ncbi:unnamed protein product [Pieris macdunnoughi]|uniref:Regulatory protein zeste n=1 Tax=Pieris macdunnoughi TaxID=345717 RepID=A0A821UX41_9NEOP|nr:unnamed protein product [Pieris macdunnoughi]